MNSKRILFAIQDKGKNAIDPNYAKNYPTIDDLMKEQNILRDGIKTVHHRRDLDSLG